MRYRVAALLPLFLLASCSLFEKGEYAPEYLQEESPLDPPGMAAARQAARAKMLKEGIFETGSTQEVHQGKAFLFNRNPDHTEDVSGKMVSTQSAKIIACEGLYYFVQVDDGSKGFLRESDLVSPVVNLVSTEFGAVPGVDPTAAEGSIFPDSGALFEDGTQKLMTNSDGRTVVIADKKSDRSEAFEARKRAMLERQNAAAGEADAAAQPDPSDVPLPEPSGTFQD